MTASTVSVAASARRFGKKSASAALTGNFFTTAVASTSVDEQDDIVEIGYIPAGVTVFGFMVAASDMDTGSPALVFKLILGSTDVVTGITVGQGGTASIHACLPYTTTAPTLLKMQVTTAAATGAAGTLYTTPIYQSV